MIDAADTFLDLKPGQEPARADERQHGHLARARRQLPRVRARLQVMPANATPERRLLLELYGATIVESPGEQGSNGAVRLGGPAPRRTNPSYVMLFQYANEWNPRAHYEGTGAEIVDAT